MAIEHEKYTHVPQIVRWMQRLLHNLESNSDLYSSSNFWADNHKIMIQAKHEMELLDLLEQMKAIYQNHVRLRDKMVEKQVAKLIRHPLLQEIDSTYIFNSKIAFYEVHGLYFLLEGSEKKAFDFYEKLIHCWHQHENKIQTFQDHYYRNLFDYVRLGLATQQKLELYSHTSKLKVHAVPNEQYLIQLILLMYENKKVDDSQIVQMTKKIKSSKNLFTSFTQNYYFGIVYFFLGYFKKALVCLNPLLDHPYKNLGDGMQNFARLLIFLIHYEKDDILLITIIAQ